MADARLILASASPRRRDLLDQIGVTPDLIAAADIDETALPGEDPRQHVTRLARTKAETISKDYPKDLVLAADTIVVAGARILGKPKDRQDAARYLALLSGRRHQVATAVCLIDGMGGVHGRLVISRVSFKRLHQSEIDAYLDSGEWDGKAGAYAIQGRADAFVKAINGPYSNIVGLPLYETKALLMGAGFIKA